MQKNAVCLFVKWDKHKDKALVHSMTMKIISRIIKNRIFSHQHLSQMSNSMSSLLFAPAALVYLLSYSRFRCSLIKVFTKFYIFHTQQQQNCTNIFALIDVTRTWVKRMYAIRLEKLLEAFAHMWRVFLRFITHSHLMKCHFYVLSLFFILYYFISYLMKYKNVFIAILYITKVTTLFNLFGFFSYKLKSRSVLKWN